jgi:hypothetical protein
LLASVNYPDTSKIFVIPEESGPEWLLAWAVIENGKLEDPDSLGA